MVMSPFTRASLAPTIKTAAIYVTLMNHGATDDTLLNVTTPAADSAALHTSTDNNGVMEMRETGALPLAANATVKLSPGGTHIMLSNLKAPLKVGDIVQVTLQFAKAGNIIIDVPVLAITVDAPTEDHSKHQ